MGPPKPPATPARGKRIKERDPRIPAPGTVLKATHKGKEYTAKVLEQGFEYRGKTYRSLSAIAKEVTGCSWNGLVFFGLGKLEKPEAVAPNQAPVEAAAPKQEQPAAPAPEKPKAATPRRKKSKAAAPKQEQA